MTKNIVELNDGNFEAEVLKYAGSVLVDFWAEWCGPCKMIAPAIETLADEYVGRVKVGKYNIQDNRDIPARMGIQAIPTIIIFKDGKENGRLIGAAPKEKLEELIKKGL